MQKLYHWPTTTIFPHQKLSIEPVRSREGVFYQTWSTIQSQNQIQRSPNTGFSWRNCIDWTVNIARLATICGGNHPRSGPYLKHHRWVPQSSGICHLNKLPLCNRQGLCSWLGNHCYWCIAPGGTSPYWAIFCDHFTKRTANCFWADSIWFWNLMLWGHTVKCFQDLIHSLWSTH